MQMRGDFSEVKASLEARVKTKKFEVDAWFWQERALVVSPPPSLPSSHAPPRSPLSLQFNSVESMSDDLRDLLRDASTEVHFESATAPHEVIHA